MILQKIMAVSEWIFILMGQGFFLLIVIENAMWKGKSSAVKYGLRYSSPVKSSIHVSELICSAKAEKTFVAQSQVPLAISEKHDKLINAWGLAS